MVLKRNFQCSTVPEEDTNPSLMSLMDKYRVKPDSERENNTELERLEKKQLLLENKKLQDNFIKEKNDEKIQANKEGKTNLELKKNSLKAEEGKIRSSLSFRQNDEKEEKETKDLSFSFGNQNNDVGHIKNEEEIQNNFEKKGGFDLEEIRQKMKIAEKLKNKNQLKNHQEKEAVEKSNEESFLLHLEKRNAKKPVDDRIEVIEEKTEGLKKAKPRFSEIFKAKIQNQKLPEDFDLSLNSIRNDKLFDYLLSKKKPENKNNKIWLKDLSSRNANESDPLNMNGPNLFYPSKEEEKTEPENFENPHDSKRKELLFNLLKKPVVSLKNEDILIPQRNDPSLLIDNPVKNNKEGLSVQIPKREIPIENESKFKNSKKKKIQLNKQKFDFDVDNMFIEETNREELMEKLTHLNNLIDNREVINNKEDLLTDKGQNLGYLQDDEGLFANKNRREEVEFNKNPQKENFNSPIKKKNAQTIEEVEKSSFRMSSGKKSKSKNEKDYDKYLKISNFTNKKNFKKVSEEKSTINLQAELAKLNNTLKNLQMNLEDENGLIRTKFEKGDIRNILIRKYNMMLQIERRAELLETRNGIIENFSKFLVSELELTKKKKSDVEKKQDKLKEKIFEKFSNLKLNGIKFFPNSKNLEYTFLYKKYFTILMEKKESENYIHNLQIFLLDSYKLFTLKQFEKEEEQKKLTDIFLKFFSTKYTKNRPVPFFESLDYLCYIFNKFENVINQLMTMIRDFTISGLFIDKEGKFIFSLQMLKIPYFDLVFTLHTSFNFQWFISYKIENLTKNIRKILSGNLDRVFEKVDSLIKTIFADQALNIEVKLARIFNDIHFISLTEEDFTKESQEKIKN